MNLLLAAGKMRFPLPQLPEDYCAPWVTCLGRDQLWEWFDVGVLIVFLSLAAWFALRVRRRRWIAVLSILCLIYFGFWRSGCVCTVGSIGNVTLAMMDSSINLPLSVLAFFLIPMVFTLFWGRGFCAAVCPLGSLQDLVSVWSLPIPAVLERFLRLSAYLFLGLAILHAATGGRLLICQYDPFVSLFWREGQSYQWVLLAIVLGVSLVIGRPYCRFLCPYGVLLRQMSRIAKWRVTVSPQDCIKCRSCEKACPFGAIRKPEPKRPSPSVFERRRLLILMLALPIFVGLGASLGNRYFTVLGSGHPKVRNLQRLENQAAKDNEDKLKLENILKSKQAELKNAQSAVEPFRRGAGMLGGVIFLMIGLKLMGAYIHYRRNDYEADRGDCLACGRCFAYCPIEKQRREGKHRFIERTERGQENHSGSDTNGGSLRKFRQQ
jgi:NosR/NirI family nitrous oxide reductase transcriptional regulator